jgi:large subunit ribosomal protein L27
MAHKKAAGSVKNGRDSISKRLGVKKFGSEKVNSGEILVRQRGTKFHAGVGVKRTSDDTLVATVDGVLEFVKKRVLAFNGNLKKRTFLNIVDAPVVTKEVKKPKSTAVTKTTTKVTKSVKAPATKKVAAVKKATTTKKVKTSK